MIDPSDEYNLKKIRELENTPLRIKRAKRWEEENKRIEIKKLEKVSKRKGFKKIVKDPPE